MNRLTRSSLWQLSLWRFRELAREPEAMFWVFAFPIILAFALGLAFKTRGVDVVRVAVADGAGAAPSTARPVTPAPAPGRSRCCVTRLRAGWPSEPGLQRRMVRLIRAEPGVRAFRRER